MVVLIYYHLINLILIIKQLNIMDLKQLTSKVKSQFNVEDTLTVERANVNIVDYYEDYVVTDEPLVIVYKDKDNSLISTAAKTNHYISQAQILGVTPNQPVQLDVDDIEGEYRLTIVNNDVVKAELRVTLTKAARLKYNNIIVSSLKARSLKNMYSKAIGGNNIELPQL